MTTRAPLVRISGKIVELPAGDYIGGAPAGASGTSGLTTKGDLLTFSTLVVRLGVGADGTVLTADSTQATGIKWAAVVAGVSSVTAGNTTLTISPTTGAVVASLNLGNANTWTAKQTFRASTTSAATAGIYLQSGTLMSTAEVGAVEFLTDKFYATITTSAARKELALNDAALTAGRVPFVTTNGRLVDNANFLWDSSTGLVSARGTGGGSVVTSKQTANGTGDFAGFKAIVNNVTEGADLTATGPGFSASGIFVAAAGFCYGNQTGGFWVGNGAAGPLGFFTGGTAAANIRGQIDTNGNWVVGTAALATTATDGFLHIPTCAGPPTGVPTGFTGRVPIVYDSTNNFLYVRAGGTWKKSTVYA